MRVFLVNQTKSQYNGRKLGAGRERGRELNIGPAHYLNIRRYAMRRKALLLLVAVLLLLGGYAPTYAADAIKLKFANFFPPVHKNAVIFDQFSQEINKKSNGKVEISYYPGGTLLTAPKIAAGVATGIADIGLSHCAYSRGRFPVMEAMELPLGFPSGYIGSHAANDFYDKFKPKEWEQFQPLVFGFSPPAIMQTVTKPVRTLEDLKGLKIRGTGRIGDIVKALGATPMPLEMVDLYESLRRGVIDGNFGPLEQLKGFKTGEIIKYASASWRVGAAYTFYVAMNKRKWDSLPPDMKKLFTDVSNEYKDKWAVEWNMIDIEGGEFLKSQGGQIVPISDTEASRWVKAAEPVIGEFKKDLVGKGFKDSEVDGWIAFLKERIEYWKGQEKANKIPTVYQY
jgi:TRAP-type C4-dicarboxylate transport system substrate-binding protein